MIFKDEEMFLIVDNYIYIKTCHLSKQSRGKSVKCFVLNHFYCFISISDSNNGITCNKNYLEFSFKIYSLLVQSSFQ